MFFRWRSKEWIIERDGVAPVGFDVDTQDFSEQGLRALGIAVRLDRARPIVFVHAAITGADVKIIFVPRARAEADPVPVVSVRWLIGSDYSYFAPWIGEVGIRADRKARDVGHALIEDSTAVCRVGDVEKTIG